MFKRLINKLLELIESKYVIAGIALGMMVYGFIYWSNFSGRVDEVANSISKKNERYVYAREIELSYEDLAKVLIDCRNFEHYSFDYAGKRIESQKIKIASIDSDCKYCIERTDRSNWVKVSLILCDIDKNIDTTIASILIDEFLSKIDSDHKI